MQNDEYIHLNAVRAYTTGENKTKEIEHLNRRKHSGYFIACLGGALGVMAGGMTIADFVSPSEEINHQYYGSLTLLVVGCGVIMYRKLTKLSKAVKQLEEELDKTRSTPEYKEGKNKLEGIL